VTTCVARRRAFLGAALAACLVGTAGCGQYAQGEEVTTLAPPPAAAGHPPGSITLPMGTEMGVAVKKVQDAITADGGTVLASVDNAADASAVGATVPANTVVIGGPPAAGLPMLRTNQQAAAALPERYLVHQTATGAVQLVYNGPDYVAVVSGVIDQTVSNPFAQSVTKVADQTTGTTGDPKSAPLIGVSPTGYLRVAPSNASVPVTLARLTTEVKSAAETVVATQDLANGSGGSGPALRATTSILVSAPTLTSPLVAAAPTFGLELPLRFVIWLDDKNVTQVGYVDVGVLAARHGLKADDPNVAKVAAECDRLAKIATAG
jgi:uncharacterized protein (DUF302 family)